jgi:hypothetical protein
MNVHHRDTEGAEVNRLKSKRGFLMSKWFDMWVMSNWRDLVEMGSGTNFIFICTCCPHRTDSYDMNCIECCPISRAFEMATGARWETEYFAESLRSLCLCGEGP